MRASWTAAVLWSVVGAAAGIAPVAAAAQYRPYEMAPAASSGKASKVAKAEKTAKTGKAAKAGKAGKAAKTGTSDAKAKAAGAVPAAGAAAAGGAAAATAGAMSGMAGMNGMEGKSAEAKEAPAALVAYEVSDGPATKAINASLTGKPGDPANGEKVMIANPKGNCFACHEVAALQHKAANDPVGYSDMGQIGPRLDGVAARYTEGEMRMLLVNAKQVFPQTIMPAFYRLDGLHRMAKDKAGMTILQPQEIEDVVAFLGTLKEPQRSEKVAKGAEPTSPVAGLYNISDGPTVKAIEASLTGKPGDAANGEKVMVANPKGNCFACHEVAALQHKAASDPVGYSDMGQIGPRLDGVGARYTEGELRMLLVDSKQVFPQTIMPSFLRKEGLHRMAKDKDGKTILEPQEVEDVIALLMKLNVDPTAGMGGMSGMRDVR